MAIIAILAIAAIPLYGDYTRKAKAVDAWEELSHIAVLQEQIRTDFRKAYDTSGETIASYGAKLSGKHYTIELGAQNIWTATAYVCLSGGASGACTQSAYDIAFTLDHAGTKTSTYKDKETTPGWHL